jgi:hypothetical protein
LSRLDSTAQSKSIKYQIEVTGAAQKCWFNQSGDWAFAYSFGGQDHHVYAWPVSDSSKIQHYEYDVVSTNHTCDLLELVANLTA